MRALFIFMAKISRGLAELLGIDPTPARSSTADARPSTAVVS